MVARLQRKTGLGLANADCVDFLNEAFRKVNQMSKGGFIWQFKGPVNIVTPLFSAPIALPADFDPGKTAVLRGNATPTSTVIPYVPMKDFVNQAHFETGVTGFFSAWTFFPSFTVPTLYAYLMQLAPTTAMNGVPYTLQLWYHAVNFAPVALGASNYFPTPDQFDSMIVDLAVAEVRNIYRMSGDQQEMNLAMQAIMEVIDTYRTDRYDLAGLTDQMAQAQEKQVEKAK
jgi:hypothetical protein